MTAPTRERTLPPRPRVSVLMISYNQSRYIAAAVESVLAQQGDFELQIVIGDDCSTDGTREIVAGYAAKHRDRVRVLPRMTNLGVAQNFNDVFEHCDGDVLAILEGDDYWTDPSKLQTQIDALRSHPEWSICFHAVDVLVEGGGPIPPAHASYPARHPPGSVFTRKDLLLGNKIPTCSAMLRGGLVGQPLPDWLKRSPLCDWPLFLLQTLSGGAGYLDRQMAVYRIHPGGVWSYAKEVDRNVKNLAMLDHVQPTVDDPSERRAIRRTQQILANSILSGRVASRDFAGSFAALRECLRRNSWLRSQIWYYAYAAAAARLPLVRRLAHRVRDRHTR